MTTEATPATADTKKAKTQYTSVKMTDGKLVDFPGERTVVKEGFKAENGDLVLRMNYRNGEFQQFVLAPEMIPFYALHGGKQKYGDEYQSADSMDAGIMACAELHDRIDTKHEWREAREAGDSFSGSSAVVQGMCKVTGKSKQEIADYLAATLAANNVGEKKLSRQSLYAQIRATDRFGPTIKEIEDAAKAKKGANVPQIEITI